MLRVVMTTATRPQTLGEVNANAISHGLGFLLTLAALPILVVRGTRGWDPVRAGVGEPFPTKRDRGTLRKIRGLPPRLPESSNGDRT